jgi:hypothetical protein
MGGTSARDLPGNVENCQDLNARSDRIPGALGEVMNTLAQDPAYRPTHPKCRNPNQRGGTLPA